MNHLKFNKKIILLITVMIMILSLAVPAIAENDNMIVSKSGNNVSLGSDVYLNETANGDVVSIGGDTTALKGANGEVVSIGGNVKAKGTINGNVVAIGGDATVEGNVNGEVTAMGGKAILKGDTVVNGNVVASEIIKDPNVVIKGEIVKTNLPNIRVPYINGRLFSFQPWILPIKFIGLLFSFAIMCLVVALYPNGVETIAQSVGKDTWRVLGVGFVAWLILFPLFLIILGIPLVIFLYISAKFLGYAGVTLFIGRKFMHSVSRDNSSIYLQVLMGVVLIGFIKFFPIIGMLTSLVAFWLSLGAMLDTKFGTGRPWFNRS